MSGVDEDSVTADSFVDLVQQLADAKASVVADLIRNGVRDATLVLGCDSMLEFSGEILGKPATPEEATERWLSMRGKTGTLLTGHTLISLPDGLRARGVASTDVRFADVSDEEIAEYIATGEPLNVAGAFTIDGLGGWYVEAIAGDHHNVVGLSLPLLRTMLHELSLRVSDLR